MPRKRSLVWPDPTLPPGWVWPCETKENENMEYKQLAASVATTQLLLANYLCAKKN